MAVVAQTQLGSLPTALGKYREYLAKAPNAPNAAEVQSVIRQIETTLNPRPATPVVAAVNLPSASNTLARVVTPTNAPPKPTNLVTAASSNTVRIASAKTNVPATATGPDLETSAKATNQPPVRLAGTEAARTNQATVVNPPVTQTEPKTTKVAAANPAHTPTTATSPVTRPAEPESPLEEVKVADSEVAADPEIRPAGEIQKPVTAPASPGSSSPSSEAPQTEERKRGFFKRINPVNLFRSDKPEQPARRPTGTVTPLPPENSASANAAARATSTPPSTTVARNERPDVTPMPGSTSAARYEYGRVKRPVAGDRGSAERLFERGIGAQSRQDPAGATTFFEAAVKADGTYFAAHYNLGLISYAGGQWFKALSAFETALVLDPNSAEARYNFALALQKARFPQDAARELERVLAQNPRDARAALLLGKVQAEDLKDVAAARRQYQRVLELEPQHPQAAAIRFWLSEHP
jgi:hypothetical protein